MSFRSPLAVLSWPVSLALGALVAASAPRALAQTAQGPAIGAKPISAPERDASSAEAGNAPSEVQQPSAGEGRGGVPSTAELGEATGAAVASPEPVPPALAPAVVTPSGDEPKPSPSLAAGIESSNAPPPVATNPTAPQVTADGEQGAEPSLLVTGSPGQGMTLSTGNAFSLNIKGRMQLRYQMHVFDDPDKEPQQLASLGTARVYLGGNVYGPEITYLIQLALAARDYRDGAVSPVYDAYLELRPHRDFSVRVGQYFVPFDRLRTVREWALQTTERPRPIQEFTLDRDVGITFFSERFLGDGSPFAWYLSVFGGRGMNQVNTSEVGGLVTGRLELRPLGAIDDDREGDPERREKPGLALGVGAAHNANSNRVRGTSGPSFVGGATNDTYVAVDGVFKWEGLALEAEYLRKRTSSMVFISEQPNGETLTEYTHEGSGWVVQASYAFDPPFEVVARLARTYYDGTQDPAFVADINRRGSELGGGLNYYFNGHRMKAQFSWVARSSADLALNRADQSVTAQIDATF